MNDEEEPQASPKVRKLRRDRNAGVQMDYVPVPTASELPYYAGVGLSQALIKHILFIRQQIPMPYDQLRSQIKMQEEEQQQQQRSRRPNSYMRKARKVVEATDCVLEGLSKIMSRSRVVGMLVSLGPTPINPKEAFILRFDANGIPILPDGKPAKDPSRQMIRQLVTSGLDQFDKPALPLKMFVLVLVAEAPGERGDSEMQQAADDEGATRWHGGWVPRHGFAPKLRRCKPVGISVGNTTFCEDPFPSVLTGHGMAAGTIDAPPQADFESMSMSAGPGLVWLQHSSFIRGLPHESQGL